MKKRIVLSILVTLVCSFLKAQYAEGIKAYRANNFSAAITAFTAEPDSLSYEWNYNLGNAYYKNNDLGEAILHWKKSLRLNPGYTQAKENLDIASTKVLDKIDPSPAYNFAIIPVKLLSNTHAYFWGIIALISFLLALLIFILKYASRHRYSKIVTPFILLGFISAGIGIWTNTILTSKNQAIILEQEIDVQTQPSLSTTAFVLHEGTEVKIINEEALWFEIEIPSGNSGWIQKKHLGII